METQKIQQLFSGLFCNVEDFLEEEKFKKNINCSKLLKRLYKCRRAAEAKLNKRKKKTDRVEFECISKAFDEVKAASLKNEKCKSRDAKSSQMIILEEYTRKMIKENHLNFIRFKMMDIKCQYFP